MRNERKIQTYPSFHLDVIHKYDGFILDQWGVLHDGTAGLEGASECVKLLAEKFRKKLIILSNSTVSAKSTLDQLPNFGFDPRHFVGAVTSGETTSQYVREHYKHQTALWITWNESPTQSSPTDFLRQCGDIHLTTSVSDADFVLLQGAEIIRGSRSDAARSFDNTVVSANAIAGAGAGAAETSNANSKKNKEEYSSSGIMNDNNNAERAFQEEEILSLGSFHRTGQFNETIYSLLEECSNKKLPMVVANPDFEVVHPDGSQVHMPGKIAKLYEERFCGKCIWFGKPHANHFEACLRELRLDKSKIAHVGDSLHHDIAGANACGIESIFVVGGVHRHELGCALGSLPVQDDDSLSNLFDKYQQYPTYTIPMFKM